MVEAESFSHRQQCLSATNTTIFVHLTNKMYIQNILGSINIA